ncbi:hypothetical protein B0H63DRAFT_449323 [Podospora didyma]|uniref:C2H2-type domain-containing protein n=1 Tax=Podospora didyma TaxID=330526 RepID=A0AAE0TZI5_9PEZI|nr:hypothetical protein B0H63DRAFT_449323 [Podospora didyma]
MAVDSSEQDLATNVDGQYPPSSPYGPAQSRLVTPTTSLTPLVPSGDGPSLSSADWYDSYHQEAPSASQAIPEPDQRYHFNQPSECNQPGQFKQLDQFNHPVPSFDSCNGWSTTQVPPQWTMNQTLTGGLYYNAQPGPLNMSQSLQSVPDVAAGSSALTQQLNEQNNTGTSTRIKCNICNKEFRNQSNKDRHFESKHNPNVPKYHCVCGYTQPGPRKDNYTRHLQKCKSTQICPPATYSCRCGNETEDKAVHSTHVNFCKG